MCSKSISRSVCFVVLYFELQLLPGSFVNAAEMTVTNLFPAAGAVEVCADTKLWITFGTTPVIATSGTLQICRVSDDNVVYQLVLQALPVDGYGPVATGWPYQITLNGLQLNYQPFAVSGKTVEIYPSARLEYNNSYYVKMAAGFCTDSNGNSSPEINDNTTWRFTTRASVPPADNDYTVALDGSGDFCTLQGAIDAVTDNDPNRTLIKIRKGTYRELVNIPAAKANVTWLGEDRDSTIMAAYNRNAFNTAGSDYRMMLRSRADGFRMYNMTFRNTAPDNSGQAETIKHSGLQGIADNCKFKSYQDTVCLNGQMYFNNCCIEGDTDYIWGSGTVYFDKCEMRCLSSGSYVTQPRTAASDNGFFLVDCNLTGPPGPMACYLGRTTGNDYPYCQSVYLNCTMPALLFFPPGWKIATGTDTNNLRWWEYKSVDPSGNLIEVSFRDYSRQLTDGEAVTWRDVNSVFAVNPWNPKNLPDLPTASWLPQPVDGANDVNAEGTVLTWSAGAAAASHKVYFGTDNSPDIAAEQNNTSFATGQMSPGTTYYWRVDEKNPAGVTTGPVWSFTTLYICTNQIASDLDRNCQVDLFDFAELAGAWVDALPEADLNGDGFIDSSDIDEFVTDWMICNRVPQSECWQ